MIGANANRLIPNTDADPISASVAHRGAKLPRFQAVKCRPYRESIASIIGNILARYIRKSDTRELIDNLLIQNDNEAVS